MAYNFAPTVAGAPFDLGYGGYGAGYAAAPFAGAYGAAPLAGTYGGAYAAPAAYGAYPGAYAGAYPAVAPAYAPAAYPAFESYAAPIMAAPVVQSVQTYIQQPIVEQVTQVFEAPAPPPPPQPRVSVVAKSRDPRVAAAANELLRRYRGVPVTNPADLNRLLDSSARTLSRAMPNPVVA